MSDDIFRHADKSTVILFRDISREFQHLALTLPFDELNILGVRRRVNATYAHLENEVHREYVKIAEAAFKDACKESGKKPSGFDAFGFVETMLKAYDPISDFVYTREWTRKRDRLFESIISTERGDQERRKNLKRNMDVLARQVKQYADNITVDARLEGFQRSGVEYVRWVTERDEKVCSKCAPRDGRIYRIDEIRHLIPAHWNCRCVLFPATEEEYNAQAA